MVSRAALIPFVLLAILEPVRAVHSLAPAQELRRFEGVTNSDNPLIEKDGRALALYIDRARETIPQGPAAEAQAILNSVTLEGPALLAKLEPAKLVLKQDRLMFGGAPLRRFVLIAVYPKVGVAGTGRLATPVTFSPGSTRAIEKLRARFGLPRETEVWFSAITRRAALDANVSWWGEVGVAVAVDGSITHVLVRQAVDLTL